MLKKLLIVYHRAPPIAANLQKAFLRQGIQTEIFYTTDYEHWFYYRIIRRINRLAAQLKLVRKGTDLFHSHPLNLINYVSSNFENTFSRLQPDAVLVIHGLPFGEIPLSRITVPKIGWHLEPRDDLPYLINNAQPFDIYNSFSQKDVSLLTETGFDCRYLHHVADPELFFNDPTVCKQFDLTFVGNWSAWRDETLQAALAVTQNIALYGSYWLKKSTIAKPLLQRIYRGQEIIGPDLNQLFNASKIVLNASRIPGSYGLNMRFFEVLAAGGVLLTDPVPELEQHFIAGKHLAVYHQVADLKKQLHELLLNVKQRNLMSQAGQNRVREQANYDLMAAHFLAQFHEISSSPAWLARVPRAEKGA